MISAPDAAVEHAAEPHNQPDDAGRVHGRNLAGALPISDFSQVLRSIRSKHLNTRLEGGLGDANVYLGSEVEVAVGVWLVRHGRHGEVHHVERDEAGLKQTRVGQSLLDLGEHGGDGKDAAQEHVEGDEELVKLALAHHGAGVVSVAQDNHHQGHQVEEASYRQ